MSEKDQPWMGRCRQRRTAIATSADPDATYDVQDRAVIDTVLKHGWQVILVVEGAGCDHPDHDDRAVDDHDYSGPAFAYTIGLQHRAGHPELLMSGLDHDVMHRVLNSLARRILAGLRISAGAALEDVLAGVPVAVEEVSDAALADTVTWAGWFHRRKPEALAIVWPDRSGVFRWQPGAPVILDELQPPAWRVSIAHADGLAADPTWEFPVPPDHRAFSCAHVVDRGDAVLWAAREVDEERGEDWSIHCGAAGHEVDDMRLVHLAHLVRSAPSLRRISGLGLDEEAWRDDPDSPWQTARICRDGS